MVALNTNKDLLFAVHNVYGHSHEWISGLAKQLDVSYHTARKLAVEAGYHRHRIVANVSLDEFSRKPSAQFVIKKKGLVIVYDNGSKTARCLVSQRA